jgi:Protein of unknown function (DUF2892)
MSGPSTKETEMRSNEGMLDRGLRVAGGVLLIGLAASGVVGAWGYIGVVPLLTGAVGMCPLYSILGINTCPANRR